MRSEIRRLQPPKRPDDNPYCRTGGERGGSTGIALDLQPGTSRLDFGGARSRVDSENSGFETRLRSGARE